MKLNAKIFKIKKKIFSVLASISVKFAVYSHHKLKKFLGRKRFAKDQLQLDSQQLVDMLIAERVISDSPLAKFFLLIKVRKFP